MLEWIARIGYVARAVVFLILGGLAILAAFGTPHGQPDTKTALHVVMAQPLGAALLAVVALGLLCFALWRFGQAIFDADRRGLSLQGLGLRLAYGASGIFYLIFAGIAGGMVIGLGDHKSGNQAARDWTAWVLAYPYGRWLIGAIGLAIVITGIGIAVAGVRAKFRMRLKLKEAPRWIVAGLGVCGYLARAIVFVMIGLFLLFAALGSNFREAKGFSGALEEVQRLPLGGALFAIVAAGLIAFGLFELAEAGYRRIKPPPIAARSEAKAS